jgi:diaminohydroxyphosphoribosylaminopyrimidine deaminase/5-amino-6-(5-phosphoribosylamino)uracil reductase
MGDGIGMANVTSMQALEQRQDWQIIDHSLFGPDLRIRLIRN